MYPLSNFHFHILKDILNRHMFLIEIIVNPYIVLFFVASTYMKHNERNRFARDDKVPGPQLGAKQLPGERPRNPPRRDTRALGPAGMFGGKAPPRLAAQKSRPHARLRPVRCAPAYFLCKWGV